MNTENQELNSIIESLQATGISMQYQPVNIDALSSGLSTLSVSEPIKNVEITHSKEVQVTSGPYKGKMGEIESFTPAMFTIILDPTSKIQFRQTPNMQLFSEGSFQLYNFETDTPEQKQLPRVIITKGMFRGRKGTIVEYKKPSITVRLIANKLITGLDPSEIFYKDIRLQDGDYFYVQKVYKNGNYGGLRLLTRKKIENGKVVGILPPVNVMNPDKEIHNILSPFRIREISDEELSNKRKQMIKDLQGSLIEAGEPIKGLKRQFEESEYVQEVQTSEENGQEYLPDEEMLEQLKQDQEFEEEQEFMDDEQKLVTGFADTTRTRMEERPLTEEEETVLSEVNKINLNDFDQGILENENLKSASISIAKTLDQIYKLDPTIENKIATDNRYFIAAAFIYELLNKNFDPNLYIKTLISNNYFSSKNMGPISNLDMPNFWTPFPIIEQLPEIALASDKARKLKINEKNLKKIVGRFLRALAIVKNVYSDLQQQPQIKSVKPSVTFEAMPLIRVEQPVKISFPIQLITGNIPEESKKMIWGTELGNIIADFKLKKIQERKADDKPPIDNIILSNLEQFYYFDTSVLTNEQAMLYNRLVEELMEDILPILNKRYNNILFKEYVDVVKSMRNVIKNPIQLEPGTSITYKNMINMNIPKSLRDLLSGNLQAGSPVDLSSFVKDITESINDIDNFFKRKKLNIRYISTIPQNLNVSLYRLQETAKEVLNMREQELNDYLRRKIFIADPTVRLPEDVEADIIYQTVAHYLLYPVYQFLLDYQNVLFIREAKKQKKEELQQVTELPGGEKEDEED